MKTLTVFTPAFNRAHTLERTYNSLLCQTSKDFEWLIVDDGSSDNTKQLVEGWIKEGLIPIRYIYQENQGMHGAHNTAYANITTLLNTCIDSDDWMPDNAVETIINFWEKYGTDDVAGMVGLDQNPNGVIIGNEFTTPRITMWKFNRSGGKGDKKIVYRTEVIKKYPKYPIFKGEHYVSLATLYFMIDQDYELLTLNTPLVTVEYQEDGSSYNMYKNYVKNPKGFVYDRKLVLATKPDIKSRIKYCIHYVANKILAGESRSIITDSPCRLTTFLMLPFGIAWYLIILKNYKTGKKLKI